MPAGPCRPSTMSLARHSFVAQAPPSEFEKDVLQVPRRQISGSRQLLRSAEGNDAAVVHDRHAVAEPLGLFHVVRRIEQRAAGPAEFQQGLEYLVPRLSIDANRRL